MNVFMDTSTLKLDGPLMYKTFEIRVKVDFPKMQDT